MQIKELASGIRENIESEKPDLHIRQEDNSRLDELNDEKCRITCRN